MKKDYWIIGWLENGKPTYKIYDNEKRLRTFMSNTELEGHGKETVRKVSLDDEEAALIFSDPSDFRLIQKKKELVADLKERFVKTVGQLFDPNAPEPVAPKPLKKYEVPNSPAELLKKRRPWFWKDKTNSSLSFRDKP